MAQQGLPSSLDIALTEAERSSFGLPAELQSQFRQQEQRAEQRKQANQQPIEMPAIPTNTTGGKVSAGTGKVPYMEHFTAAAQRYGVPVNVLMGLAQQESRFNPTALGTQTKWGRAKGLMQYLDSTAAGMGINPYDPAQSIDAAAKQLKQRLDKGYTMIDAVREHFAGPNKKQWGSKTHTYGIEVMQRADRFGNIVPSSGGQEAQPTQAQSNQPKKLMMKPELLENNRYQPLSADALRRFEEANERGDSSFIPHAGAKPIKINGADPITQKQRQQKIDDVGILSQFGDALGTGYDNTKRHMSNSSWLMTGSNTPTVAEGIYAGYQQQQKAQKNRTSGQKRLDAAIDAVGDGNGFFDTLKRGASAVGVAITEPRATFVGAAESAASMLPTIAGGLAGAGAGGATGAAGGAVVGAPAGGVGAIPGAIAGGTAGAIWGSRVGMVAGTTATEAGAELEHMVFERLKKEKKSVTKESIQTLLNDPKFRAEAQKQGTAKGLTLAMVDQLTMGAAGRVLSAPAKAAEKKAIAEIVKDTGVDEKVARSLLAAPAGRKALEKASPGTLKKAAAATGAFSIELMGEPAGEAISQAVARGEVDWSDVAGELIYGGGQAVAGTVAAGGYNAAKSASNSLRSSNISAPTDPAPAEQQPQAQPQEQAANQDIAAPIEAAPADDIAPARKVGSIERSVGGEQFLDGAIEAELASLQSEQVAADGTITNEGTMTNAAPTAEQWLGAPGAVAQVSPKEDPDSTYTVTVESYENGEVFARDQDGTPVQFSQDDIVQATPVEQPQEQAQPQSEADLDPVEVPELSTFEQPKQEKLENKAKAEIKAPKVEVKQEQEDRRLEDMTEAELRDRVKYLARQAKTNGGWDKRLMAERRKVEAEIGKKGRENTPSISDLNDGFAKWEGMNPAERMAAAEKAGIEAGKVKDLSSTAWGMIDQGSMEKLALSMRTAKPKKVEAPKVETPKAKATKADLDAVVPEQNTDTQPINDVAEFQRLLIDAHVNNPPLKARVIQNEVKAGRPRHQVLADVKRILDDYKANGVKVEAAAPVQEVEAPVQAPVQENKTASWVIKNKETGEVIAETFDKKKVDALNKDKYEAVPILEHLQGINKDIKEKADNDAKQTDVSGDSSAADRKQKDDTVADKPKAEAKSKEVAKSNLSKVKRKLRTRADGRAESLQGVTLNTPRAKFIYGLALEQLGGDRNTRSTGERDPDPIISLNPKNASVIAYDKDGVLKSFALVGDKTFVPTAEVEIEQDAAPSVAETETTSEKITWSKHPNRKKVWLGSNGMIITDESLTSGGIKTNNFFVYRNQDDRGNGVNFARGESLAEAKVLANETTNTSNTETVEPKSKPEKKAKASENTVFTEDAAEKARALLRNKLNQLNTGIDPEIMQAGITLAGYHIEKGARSFAAYAKNMVADLGDAVKPYLKSWYMGVRFDPRASDFDGMSTSAEVESFDLNQIEVDVPVAENVETQSTPALKAEIKEGEWNKSPDAENTWANSNGMIVKGESLNHNDTKVNVFTVYKNETDLASGEHVVTKDSLKKAQDFADGMAKKNKGVRFSRADSSGLNTRDFSEQLIAEFDGLKLGLSGSGKIVTLSRIVVPETGRNSGTGTKIMQRIIDWADQNGKTIALTPSSDFGGNKKRLGEFYKRFDFIENKGRNKDYEISETMYREAQTSRFSQSEATGTGTTTTQVRETLVNRFGENTIKQLEDNGTLTIIDSYSVPNIEGFAQGNKVTLVANGLTADSIVPTFLHELGGHVGMQGTMKPQAYKNLMDQFNKLVDAKDPIALKAKQLAERESDTEARNYEYLPYLVTVASREQNQRPGIKTLISRIVSAVKAWAVDKLGVNLNLNANDILALAERMVGVLGNQSANSNTQFSRADQVNSPEFKKWFGDSKVVDEDGDPVIVYHGTDAEFTKFESSQTQEVGDYGAGFYLTQDRYLAQGYAEKRAGNNENAIVMPLYVSIKNPFIINIDSNKTEAQQSFQPIKDKTQAKKFTDDLKKQGYDGVIVKLRDIDDVSKEIEFEFFEEVIVFNPEQIKSAIDNVGTFDASNPDIRFSRADNDLGPVSDDEYRSKLRQWWDEKKQLPSDQLTNAMKNGGMGLVPLRPMLNEVAKDIPAAQIYLRIKDKMDAMRNEWHGKTDAVAQNWLKYRIKNREENRGLMEIMHESTLMQVDPSRPFEPFMTPRESISLQNMDPNHPNYKALQDKADRDDQREKAYTKLKERFDAMSPEAKSIFDQVKNAYSEMADAFDEVLLKNMEKAINVRVKKAEREHAREMERIKDEGLQGEDKTKAIDAADRALKNAKTKISWNRKARLTQLRQQFETQRLQGPYFPLARFGDLFVTVRDKETGEVLSFSRFDSATDQRRFAEEMRADKNQKVEVGALSDAAATRKAVDPNFVADVEDILADLPNAEQVKDEVWQRYLESLPDMSSRKARIHRKGRAGYNADAVRAFGHQLFHSSHQLARMAHSMDLEDALDQAKDDARHTKDPVRSGLIVNEMEKRHQFVMSPTGGQLATWASSFAFVWYLAGSPKAAIMNLFQTPIMGVPILGAYAGGINGIARAGKELSRALVDFTHGKGFAAQSSRLNDDERAAMELGYETGIIEKTQGHELAGVAETGVEYNAVREKVMKTISWGFHHTERLNREVTFLAGYRLARQKGETQDQAVSTAADLVWKTHFDYSNTSRPRLMHTDTMKILLVFRNFQINMLFRLFRDTHQAFNGDTKEARKEAFTHLAGITGMMMLNAGITGTWLFGIAMIMAGLFMEDGEDPEEELKKGIVNVLGPNLAGLALYGAPGHTTGTALSESIGMPDLWFRSPDSEKEGEEALNFWVSQILGAVPAIAATWARGLAQIGKGEEYRGIETMMPKMLKDPMKSYRYATEGAKNMKGDTVAEVEWSDVVKQALGFTPARISEQYKINNLNYNKQQLVLTQRKKLMDAYYEANKKDDAEAVEEVLKGIDKHNEKNPDQPITAKGIMQSIKTREKGSQSAVGGMRYNSKLRERILEEQVPSIYK